MQMNNRSPLQGSRGPRSSNNAGTIPAATLSIKPECFRLPSGRERDPYFGIGRSYWNSLVLPSAANQWKPRVKSYVLRRPGARTGVRLVDFQSAFTFVKEHLEQGCKAPSSSFKSASDGALDVPPNPCPEDGQGSVYDAAERLPGAP